MIRRLRAFCRWLQRAFARQEKLPKEFARDPDVASSTFDPVEDLWQHRQRHLLSSPFRSSC